MAIRVVSYAINGRGLGHLTRQLAILRWIRRLCTVLGVELQAWVLTSSEADTLARREGVPALKIPSKAMLRDAGLDPAHLLGVARAWVLNAVATLQPDLLLVDTLPGGSFGELGPVLEMARRRALIARPVRAGVAEDPAYASWLPLYDRVIVPDDGGLGPVLIREREELLPREAARAALGLTGRAVYVSTGGGGDPAAPGLLPELVRRLRARDWEVVVGAGPLYQGPEIRGPGVVWLDRYTPVELFPGLDAAVSAGGYNSVYELLFAGVPTVFLPQPRLADDQAARVDRVVAARAGRRARSLDEVVELLEQPGSAEAARAFVPRNGAAEVAASALSLVLPADDVAWARGAFPPALLGVMSRHGLTAAQGLGLIRLLAGELPSERARRRRVLEEAGLKLGGAPRSALDRLDAFLDEAAAVPREILLHLLEQLARKFPAAKPAELLDAMGLLLPAWAGLVGAPPDWMAPVSLLRAIPTQRQYPLCEFAPLYAAWLRALDDPYEGLRRFAALEGHGRRGLAEILGLLLAGEGA